MLVVSFFGATEYSMDIAATVANRTTTCWLSCRPHNQSMFRVQGPYSTGAGGGSPGSQCTRRRHLAHWPRQISVSEQSHGRTRTRTHVNHHLLQMRAKACSANFTRPKWMWFENICLRVRCSYHDRHQRAPLQDPAPPERDGQRAQRHLGRLHHQLRDGALP